MARPRKDPDQEILIATDDGVWMSPSGDEYPFYKEKTRVRASHPLAKAMPQSFKVITVHYDVEAMTAGPGELRGEDYEVRAGA